MNQAKVIILTIFNVFMLNLSWNIKSFTLFYDSWNHRMICGLQHTAISRRKCQWHHWAIIADKLTYYRTILTVFYFLLTWFVEYAVLNIFFSSNAVLVKIFLSLVSPINILPIFNNVQYLVTLLILLYPNKKVETKIIQISKISF